MSGSFSRVHSIPGLTSAALPADRRTRSARVFCALASLAAASTVHAQTSGLPAAPTLTATSSHGHPLRGIVTNVLTNKRLVLIEHEEIPGFLASMIRAFNVSPDIFPVLKSGFKIAAILRPAQPDGWLSFLRLPDR